MGFYTSAPSVRKLQFLDQAGDPSVLGVMQRNGDLLKYFDGDLALRSSGVAVKYKAANESVNNSTTLQDDDHLQFPIGANEIWVVELGMHYNSGTTPDLKIEVSGPATMFGRIGVLGLNGSLAAIAASVTESIAVPIGGQGGGTDGFVLGKGVFENGGTPGTLRLRWAQNTADASNTIMYLHSWLIAWRVV